ncbi:MAG: universal stress protein [Acidobacteria bacterium]|nr:universal stress protein [Acidobacteriota bacterium]
MHRYRNLMVALARTDEDAGLIRYATDIARLGTANSVRFVHVIPNSPPGAAALHHDAVLAELRTEISLHSSGMPESVQLSVEALTGPLTDRLLSHSAEAHIDLIVLGQGKDSSGHSRLGRRLAMKAPCSVWTVPRGSRALSGPILVPIDFSEHSADSLHVATSMALLSGHSECLALHVYFNEAVVTYEGYDQVLRGQEEEAYRRFIAQVNCQGVQVTPIFEEGANVPHVIGRVAARYGASVILMATRGRSNSSSILLGSVTEQMLVETRVPLLAVKHFGSRLGVLEALLDRRFHAKGGVHTV